ncbi:MAG: CDP-diacylglycerol--glycerol-3-phosphate 3-phosphatidyltransferase [Magnetovibrio sp.]|nr:CDP-diacylglycerol--glycerol-3-phosphate 3-phosphatidyltransferase [Magnetovibrio sp.]|tara:strand:+ start:148 stop:771 length:624 start_codon:yes stop_codon:yes gene_type:complete
MLINLPNVLTFSRVLAIPVVIYFILFFEDPHGSWLAFSAYTYACITDFFDGYLARVWHQQSALGRFLDPIADKLLVASVLLVLVGVDRISDTTVLPAAVILCREILVSGLREFLAEVQVGMPVSALAKWKTTLQMLALGFLLVGPNGPEFGYISTTEVGIYGLWGAALLTLFTGLDYLFIGLRQIRATDTKNVANQPDSAETKETFD